MVSFCGEALLSKTDIAAMLYGKKAFNLIPKRRKAGKDG